MKTISVVRNVVGWILAGLCAASAGEVPLFKLGAGFGNGFGGTGLGVEMETPDVAIRVGVGENAAGRPGWDLGIRYYFVDRDRHVRPSATFSYAPMQSLNYTSVPLNIDKHVNIMGYGLMGGLDQDIGARGGFIACYGLGLGYPVYSESMKNDFADAGMPLPGKDMAPVFSFGLKYQL